MSEFFRPELEKNEGESPLQFKIEITGELKKYFQISGTVFAATAIVLLLIISIDDVKINPAKLYMAYASACLFSAGALMAFFYYAAESYYIIDRSNGKITAVSRFFRKTTVSHVADFGDLHAIAVTGFFQRNDVVLYKIIAITKNAAIINLSDRIGPKARIALNKKAGTMAAIAGCLYAECPERGFIFIDHNDGEIKSVNFVVK